MNRWLSMVIVLGLMGLPGCEPPSKTEKSGSAPAVAKADTAQPGFVPRAAPKPTPTPSPTAAPPPPPPPPPPPKRLEFQELTLPSGRKLTADAILLHSRSLVSKFPTIQMTYFVDGDAKERLTAAFCYNKDGKIDGAGVAFNPETKRPIFVAQFKSSLREGGFWGWSEEGAPLYWAEFRNGQHDGLLVLIKNREPVFIQEWKQNNLKAQYLVDLIDNKEFKPREIKPSDGAIDKTVQDCVAQLKLAEERYLEEEKSHRREFVEFFQTKKHYEEYDRLTRGVAPTSPAKKEELRKRQEFQNREYRLFNAWQVGFWNTPL